MDTFITSAGALALVKALVDFIKYVRVKNTNGWATQLSVWLAGVAVVGLFRVSDLGETFTVGDVVLSQANLGTVVLAGLGLGSAAMLANEFKSAFDASDSAAKPPLVGSGTPPTG